LVCSTPHANGLMPYNQDNFRSPERSEGSVLLRCSVG
jgi:hypothetical protein